MSFSKQFPINITTNLLVFILSIFINLFMTPFYIKNVGMEGLGLLRLALSIPMYISLVTIFITGSVSRYFTIAIQEKNNMESNLVFNTALITLIILIVFSSPVFYILFANLDSLIHIPEQFKNEYFSLFIFVTLTSFLTLINSIFTIPVSAINRLDILNYINLFNTILQTLLIVTLVSYFSSKISNVGLSLFISSIFSLIISYFLLKKFATKISFNLNYFNKNTFKELSQTGSWLIVGHIGTLLFLYIDLIVVNIFYGSIGTGEYSIGLQWSTLFRNLSMTLISVISSMIMISYAQKHFDKLFTITKISIKCVGLILAIGIGLLAGYSSVLLSLWLGIEYVYLSPLLWVMLLHLSVNLAVTPLFTLSIAYNKVKIPGIVTILMGILNLILAICLAKFTDLGILSVALASAIILTSKNLIFTPIYASKISGIYLLDIYKSLFPGLLFTILVFFISFYLSKTLVIESWVSLLIIFIISFLIFSIISWFTAINKDEKFYIFNIINGKLGTKFKVKNHVKT